MKQDTRECPVCGEDMSHTEVGDYLYIADVWSCSCGHVGSSCYLCSVGIATTEVCAHHRNTLATNALFHETVKKKCDDCIVGWDCADIDGVDSPRKEKDDQCLWASVGYSFKYCPTCGIKLDNGTDIASNKV